MSGGKSIFTVGFKADKSGLNEILKQLQDIQNRANQISLGDNATKQMKQDMADVFLAAKDLEKVLNNSWNSKLGQLDLNKFNNGLAQSNQSVASLKTSLSKIDGGHQAFNALARDILNTNVQLKQSKTLLDDLAQTMTNTVKWGITSSIFNTMTDSIQNAWNYAKALDSSLNDIRIVTGKSADEMANFAVQANKVAKSLGAATKDYTNASLIYYQQGLSDADAQARAETTLKAANVTGQSGQEVSEQLTAVWNGYKVSAQESELYVDKLAAVAADTAADLEELSTGMSKVASAANLMGVDIDQLNAQMATIISVTRQAPESVGTALKTIYARMGDIKAGLDGTVSLDEYTSQMAEMGVNVLDANGNLRDMGTVIEEIGSNWKSMSREQQISLSQTMAGTRQYNNLLSLFDNWDMYTEALDTSANAAGTLQEQQDIYMESVSAHLQKLSTEAENTYDILFNQDTVNGFTDALTEMLSVFNAFLNISGSKSPLGGLGSIGALIGNVFSKQIAGSLSGYLQEQYRLTSNKNDINRKKEVLDAYAKDGMFFGTAGEKDVLDSYEKIYEYLHLMTEEEQKQYLLNQQEKGQLADKLAYYESFGEKIKNVPDLSPQGAIPKKQYSVEELNQWNEQYKAEEQIYTENETNINTLQSYLTATEDLKAKDVEIKRLQEQLTKINVVQADKINKLDARIRELKGEVSKASKESKEYTKAKKELGKKTYKRQILKTDDEKANIEATLTKARKDRSTLDRKLSNTNLSFIGDGKANIETLQAMQKENEKLGEKLQQKAEAQETVNEVLKDAQYIESEAYEQDKKRRDALKEDMELTQKRVSEEAALNSAIRITTAAITGLSTAWGILNTIMDEDIDAEEKFKQISVGIISIGASIMSILPALGQIQNFKFNFNGQELSGFTALFTSMASSLGLLTTAEGAATAGTITLGTALKALLLPFIKILGIIAAVGLAFTALYAIIFRQKIALEQAEKSAKKATAAYKELQNAWKSLKEDFTQYEEMRNAVDDMTRGTIEWKEAVQELNQKVLELVKLYPELAGKVKSEGGILSLETEDLQEVINKQYRGMQRSYRYSTLKQGQVYQKENDYSEDRISEKLYGYDEYQDEEGNTVQIAATDEEISAIISAISEYGNTIINDREEFTRVTGIENEKLINRIQFVEEDLLELVSAINENTNAYLLQRQEYVKNFLENENSAQGIRYRTSSEELQEQILNLISQNSLISEEEEKEIENKYDQGLFGLAGLDFGFNYTDKQIHQEFAKQMGLNYTKDVDTWGGAKFITGYDEKGEAQYTKYSDKEMREFLESEEKLKKEMSRTDKYFDNYQSMYNKGYDIAQQQGLDVKSADSLGKFIGSSYGGTFDVNTLSQEEYEAIKNIDLSSVLTDEMASDVGYKNAEAYLKALEAEIDSYDIDTAKMLAAEKEQAEFTKIISAGAEEFAENKDAIDETATALESYTEYLMDNNEVLEENRVAAAKVAVECFSFDKGLQMLKESISDNEQLLKDWKNGLTDSVEAYKAVAQVQEAVEQMFGLKVDASYVKDNLEKLTQLANGSTESLAELRSEAARSFLVTLNLDEASFNELDSYLDTLENSDIDIHGTFDNSQVIDGLNKMLEAGTITADQMQGLLNAVGYEPDIQWTTAKGPATTTYNRTSLMWGDKELIGFDTKTVSSSDVAVPYIANKDTASKATGTRGARSNGTGLTKVGTTNDILSDVAKNSGKSGKLDSKGGSDKDPDKKDNLKDEKDIYHDINIILKQISTELDRLEKQEEKLVGQDLIDNLNEQWGRLQDTIDATNEKIKIARGEMSRLQGELGAKGVTFNPDGTIANYAAAYDQQLATVNAVINHYNSLSADAQEGYKDTVEQAEKNWEEFLDNISEYDELVSEMIPELEDEIQAAIDEQIEIQIEKFNMEIELRLDMAEAEREWNEFKKKIIDDIEDDDILGNASAKLLDYNSYYKEDGTGIIQKNTQHVNEIIEQLKSIEATGTSSIYGDNEAQALEDLKTYYEQLMSDLTDVHDLIDEIRESYLDMMDEAQEKFDEQVETYEYIRDLLTHDMDLITMVYGDEAYDKLVDFYEKQEDNYNKQLDFQRQQKDFWKAQMDSLEEGSDEWQKAKENWMSAVEEWNSLVEEAIENLQDKYLNAINNIFANLNDKVTDGLGLDYVEQEWDLINKNADQYLDTINAVFETQQLENKYLDAIDNTDNISAQRKLNDLMKEEIKALEQKDKLTQYDIDRANLKYEIALKQIALEEAQQTKSSMRLRRDSQGNYRYEFVADNDAIAEAEDELSVLQNQLYNMDVEQYRSNLDQLYEIYVEWQEALAEAAQINDPEARAERELMINEQYGELINGIVEENEVIKTNLRESAFDELVNLHQMELEEVEALSQAEKDIMLEEMVPQWTSGVQTMADTFAGEGGFIPTCKDALIELDGATKDYEDSLLDLQYQGGFTFNDIVAGENEAIYTAMGLLQVNNELINSYKAEFDALNAVLSQLDGLIGKYGSAQNAANAAAEAAYKYADALLAQFAAANGQYTGRGSFYSSSGGSGGNVSSTGGKFGVSGTSGTGSSNSATSGAGASGRQKYHMDFVDQNQRTQYAEFWASSDEELRRKIKAMNPHEGTGILMYNMGTNKTAALSTYTIDKMKMFNTGGYTGEWNSSEGKLAMLHQKELVLNQRDTENILGAVEIMRHVTNSIDNSIFARVADFTSGIGVAAPNLANEALEQNVHIEANFPNVQNSNEVEEALNNLVNIAAQRANRNNRN